MLGRVKDILGIEGVKVDLVLPERIKAKSGALQGIIRLTSMRAQKVTSIRVVVIERYMRGWGEEKLNDEYLLGEINIEQIIPIPVGQVIEVDFTLPFTIVKSDMEEMGSRNIFYKGFVALAKKAYSVDSEFRVEAYADVKGTALNPFAKQVIRIG